jgi:hypothetical protein
VRKIYVEQAMKKASGITNYHGVLREKGLRRDGSDVVTEIDFEAPLTYRAHVTAPPPLRGNTFRYDGKSLEFSSPTEQWTVRMRNLPIESSETALKEAEQRMIDVAAHFLYRADTYHEEERPPIAGLAASRVEFWAKDPQGAIPYGDFFNFDPYSFPIGGSLRFSSGATYSFRFDSIRFNAPEPSISPAKRSGGLQLEWDFGGKPLTEAAARKLANFRWPAFPAPPRGPPPVGIDRPPGPAPAFAALYEKSPYFMTVFFSRNSHLALPSAETGIPVGSRGDLYVPNPFVGTYRMRRGDLQVTLISDLPAEELIRYGDGVEGKAPKTGAK